MNIVALPMKKFAHAREEADFAKWLRRTSRKLKNGELPPESWEQRHSPLEDSAAQRRIAALIASIAAKPREREAVKIKNKRR